MKKETLATVGVVVAILAGLVTVGSFVVGVFDKPVMHVTTEVDPTKDWLLSIHARTKDGRPVPGATATVEDPDSGWSVDFRLDKDGSGSLKMGLLMKREPLLRGRTPIKLQITVKSEHYGTKRSETQVGFHMVKITKPARPGG